MLAELSPLPRWLEILVGAPVGVLAYVLVFWWTPKSERGWRLYRALMLSTWLYAIAACVVLHLLGFRLW
jgi:hypothetical protein